MLGAFLPIIAGLIAGSSFGTVIAGLTIAEWLALGSTFITLEPTLQKAVISLHPIFAKLHEDALKFGPQTAAEKAKDNAQRVAFGFEATSNPGIFQ